MTATLQDIPSGERIHIGFFGRRNSGKSALANAFAGQEISIVSDQAGTTTDPVKKPMEICGLGACVLIDTAGFDDRGALGESRVEKTKKAADMTDIALLLCMDTFLGEEKKWYEHFQSKSTPVIPVINKSDLLENIEMVETAVNQYLGERPVIVSARTGDGLPELKERIVGALPEGCDRPDITGQLAGPGDVVLLVMPQDIHAPRGRLILPQVQTIRELLDKKCIVVSTVTEKLTEALATLKKPPGLIITDSQAFAAVWEKKPKESALTSFSVLFAAYKGDMDYYREGALRIGALTARSRVLVAECCTHAPLEEDIGREKIPRMLRRKYGENMQVDIVSGTDFPEDLTGYDLIIQCGGCMASRKYILARVRQAKKQGVPMTNYGVAIAYLTGIWDKIFIL